MSLEQKQQSSEGGDFNKNYERDNNVKVVYVFKLDVGDVSQNVKAVESKETPNISRVTRPPRCYMEKKFKCPYTYCQRSYTHEYYLSCHENEKKYTCEICGEKFCYMKLRQKHWLTHSAKELSTIGLYIDVSRPTITVRKIIDKNAEEKKTSSRHACIVCGITVETKLMLEKHMRTHGVEKVLKCEKVPSLLMLKNHTEEHAVKKASTGNVFEECLETHEVKKADKICEKRFNNETQIKKDLGTPPREKMRKEKYIRVIGKWLANFEDLSRHNQTGMEEKPLCDGKRLTSFEDLSGHNRTHMEEKPLCDGKRLTSFEDLSGHNRTHMEEKPLCDGKRLTSFEDLSRHNQTHMEEKPLCEFCGKFFKSELEFGKHVRTHTGEKPYLCDFCGKSFSQPEYFKQHRKTHTAERTYTCETCGKGFIARYELTIHLKKHSGEFPYICEFCGKMLKYRNSLRYHYHTHNEGKVNLKERYTCICGVSFIWRWQLNAHKRKHTGEKPFICNICGKSFSYAADRIRHEKIHLSTKVHTKEKANKSNNNLSGKKVNKKTMDKCRIDPFIGQGFHKKCNNANSSVMKTHTREMPYFNNLRGESSSLSTARKRGTQRHFSKKEETHVVDADKAQNSLPSTQHNTCNTGGKRHICPYCNKGFRKKFGLTSHLRTHTGEKPYECDFCGRSFSHLATIRRHVQRHLIKGKNKGKKL